jgi:predicted GNAT family acetyltransferase
MNDQIDVRDNPAESRFEALVEGYTAIAAYHRRADAIVFTHTFVPEELRGRGVGERLARHALDQARAEGLRVVPQCPFIAAFIRRHPEYQPLVDGGAGNS